MTLLKRVARRIQREQGVKYTQALGAVREVAAKTPWSELTQWSDADEVLYQLTIREWEFY